MELSRKEARLLFELGEDCRQSNLELARKLRVSKNTIFSAIDRLRKRGVLQGFYALIDNGKLGYRGIRAYLKLRNCAPKKRSEIINYLAGCPVTWWVGEIDGRFDIGIVAWVRELSDFEKFWKEFEGRFHRHVAKTCLSVYTGLYDCNFGFLEPSAQREMGHIGRHEKEAVSKNEHNVLNELSNNARERTITVAKKLRLSPLTVQQCMKRLKKKGIISGFRARIDLPSLGYTLYKMNFQLSDLKARKRMLEYSLSRPDVVFIDETIGFADLEVSIAARTHSEFRAFLDDFLKLYSKNISDYNYFIYLKVHKIRHFA